MTARSLLVDWQPAELAVALMLAKLPDHPIPSQPDKLSTVYLTSKLTNQILGYQRELQTIWDRAMALLADEAADEQHNSRYGHDEGDAAARGILRDASGQFVDAAGPRFRTAFDTGRDLALLAMTKDRLTPMEQGALIQGQLDRNAAFVRGSLFGDVYDAYGQAIRDPALSPAETKQQVQEVGASNLSRVAMYALKLWGVAHLAFGKELLADGKALRWVLTSLNPCADCPRLAKGGPYSILHPPPTMPGLGDTECFLDPGTSVFIERGWTPIEAVKVGERVLTHAGRYMPVEKVWRLPATGVPGRAVTVAPFRGRPHTFRVTPSHKFLLEDGWCHAQDLGAGVRIRVAAQADGRSRSSSRSRSVVVQEIADVPDGVRYDLTVCTDHSYVVNAGVISHNCRTNCLCQLVEA